MLLEPAEQAVAKVLHVDVVEELGRLLHAVHVAAAVVTLLLLALALQVLQVPDGHLDDLRLLDAAAPLALVLRRDEAGEVRQAGVHAVATPLLDDAVGEWILLWGRNILVISDTKHDSYGFDQI